MLKSSQSFFSLGKKSLFPRHKWNVFFFAAHIDGQTQYKIKRNPCFLRVPQSRGGDVPLEKFTLKRTHCQENTWAHNVDEFLIENSEHVTCFILIYQLIDKNLLFCWFFKECLHLGTNAWQPLTTQCSITAYLGYLNLILSSRMYSTLVGNSETKANLHCIQHTPVMQ